MHYTLFYKCIDFRIFGGCCMSRFSELLSFHIQNSGKNKVQIAEAIGMPRTNLQKISTGSRRPQDEQTVEKIMNELILSVKDREELWEAYFNDTIGSNVYGEYRECMKLLNAFFVKSSSLLNISETTMLKTFPKEIMKLQSHVELIQALQIVFQQDLCIEKDKIYLLLQPDKSSLLHQILSLIRKYPNIPIEHVICFDHQNEVKMGYAQKNLKKMRNIIELMLASTMYQAYCYYDHSDVHFGIASLFPNMIMIGEYLVCFDETESNGFVTKNKDLYDMYHEKFLHIKNYASHLFDRNQLLDTESFMSKQRYIIVYQPIMHMKKAHNDIIFYTKEGLVNFMNQAKYDSQEDDTLRRYTMLKQLKDQMMIYGNIHVLKDMNLMLNEDGIFVFEVSHQYALYQLKEEGYSIRLKEQSILNAMYRFLCYLPNSVICLSKEESREYMEALLQQYQLQHNIEGSS